MSERDGHEAPRSARRAKGPSLSAPQAIAAMPLASPASHLSVLARMFEERWFEGTP